MLSNGRQHRRHFRTKRRHHHVHRSFQLFLRDLLFWPFLPLICLPSSNKTTDRAIILRKRNFQLVIAHTLPCLSCFHSLERACAHTRITDKQAAILALFIDWINLPVIILRAPRCVSLSNYARSVTRQEHESALYFMTLMTMLVRG